MHRNERAQLERALRRSRTAAYPPGEFIGQESFMRGSEIRELAVRAGITSGVSVIDLCCGVGGPGLHIARELACSYLGVDASAEAVAIARGRVRRPGVAFEVSTVPPIAAGHYDVVLLLETILAFHDKRTLLNEIAAALPDGGRFAFTLEEGEPLVAAERARMPHADTVWLTPLPELLACLEEAGLRVRWQVECSESHRMIVESLCRAFAADEADIVDGIGRAAFDALLKSHQLWADWLQRGRVRKFAFVTEKAVAP